MTDIKPRSWEDIIGNGISRDSAPFRVVVKNTYGEEFCDAYLDLDSVDEVLADEEIDRHIKGALEVTLSEFSRRFRGFSKAERTSFIEENEAIQKMHRWRRQKGYEQPALYGRLKLPGVKVVIYDPWSRRLVHNSIKYVGWDLLGMEPDF